MAMEEPRAWVCDMITYRGPCWAGRGIEGGEAVPFWWVYQVKALWDLLLRRCDARPLEDAMARTDQPHLSAVFVDRVGWLGDMCGHENEVNPCVVAGCDREVVQQVRLRLEKDWVIYVECLGLRRAIERPFVGSVRVTHGENKGLIRILCNW